MENHKQGNGLPLYIDDSTPAIADPASGAVIDDWHPACNCTIKLVRCLEAIRDLSPICQFLQMHHSPDTCNRIVKSLATPLYSLAEALRDVHGEVGHSQFKRMKKQKRRELIARRDKFVASVFGAKNGALKTVRDKISSHIDKDTILGGDDVWGLVDLTSFLDIADICLHELDFVLQLDIYSWTRRTDDPNLIRLMNVDGTLVDIEDRNGQLGDLRSVSFVTTPKLAIAIEGRELIASLSQIRNTIGQIRR